MEKGTAVSAKADADFPGTLIRQLGKATKFSDLRDVLALYVDHFDVFGAILWEVAPGIQGLQAAGCSSRQSTSGVKGGRHSIRSR
jgi:hypothetical protein